MPRLPRLNAKQVIKLLKKSGFVKDHTSGSHFVFYHPVTKRRAVVPFHAKSLPIGTLKSILREAGIKEG